MEGVMVAFGNRGMTVEATQQYVKDRKEWIALVHMHTIEFHTAISAWPYVLSDSPPTLWWLSPGEGWDAIARCSLGNCKKGRNYRKSTCRCQVYRLRGLYWKIV